MPKGKQKRNNNYTEENEEAHNEEDTSREYHKMDTEVLYST